MNCTDGQRLGLAPKINPDVSVQDMLYSGRPWIRIYNEFAASEAGGASVTLDSERAAAIAVNALRAAESRHGKGIVIRRRKKTILLIKKG